MTRSSQLFYKLFHIRFTRRVHTRMITTIAYITHQLNLPPLDCIVNVSFFEQVIDFRDTIVRPINKRWYLLST